MLIAVLPNPVSHYTVKPIFISSKAYSGQFSFAYYSTSTALEPWNTKVSKYITTFRMISLYNRIPSKRSYS